MRQDFRQMNLRCICVVLCLLSMCITSASASEKPWTEIRSPHFRVLTNGTTPDGRKVG